LLKALQELTAEDPLLDLEQYASELNIRLMGDIQRESVEALLYERYGLSARFGAPTVIYKETIARPGEGYDAYTWPKPCWAVVRFGLEPLPRGSGFVYDPGSVRDDAMFYRYQEHVRRAVPDALKQGIMGWEVTDIKVTLLDGGHHTIHTHPLDFFVATPMAIRAGLRDCGTVLLEPMLNARITVPEDCAGRISQDFIKRRGTMRDTGLSRGRFTLEGLLPVQSALDYAPWLLMHTGGQAALSVTHAGYRECPPELGRGTPYRYG
jgi:ribosomal protection tetracycline resistance protein